MACPFSRDGNKLSILIFSNKCFFSGQVRSRHFIFCDCLYKTWNELCNHLKLLVLGDVWLVFLFPKFECLLSAALSTSEIRRNKCSISIMTWWIGIKSNIGSWEQLYHFLLYLPSFDILDISSTVLASYSVSVIDQTNCISHLWFAGHLHQIQEYVVAESTPKLRLEISCLLPSSTQCCMWYHLM